MARQCKRCGSIFQRPALGQKFCDLACSFWDKANKGRDLDCWEWAASTRNGYGQISVGGIATRAHRVSWLLHHGEIPTGKCVLHKCDNKKCVNPQHLYLGTGLDNSRDAVVRGLTRTNRGSSNPKAKLSENQIPVIRSLIHKGESFYSIARRFNVAHTSIRGIANGTHWAHVTGMAA